MLAPVQDEAQYFGKRMSPCTECLDRQVNSLKDQCNLFSASYCRAGNNGLRKLKAGFAFSSQNLQGDGETHHFHTGVHSQRTWVITLPIGPHPKQIKFYWIECGLPSPMNCTNRPRRTCSHTAGGFYCHLHAILVTAVKHTIQSKPLARIDLHIMRSTYVRLLYL